MDDITRESGSFGPVWRVDVEVGTAKRDARGNMGDFAELLCT